MIPRDDSPNHLRPVDRRRDLSAIADLIELCFANQMDEDGRDYLRQIRRVAQENDQNWKWLTRDRPSIPMGGYVWEENGRLVGNLTLIPMLRGKRWRYLIANVAVHPNFRRRGIGEQLTRRALTHIQDHGAESAWLQVRDDNPPAQDLYLKLGFQERARRTTWEVTHNPPLPFPPGVAISRRTSSDWPQQARWLEAIYPPEVSWHLNFKMDPLKPGFWWALLRFLAEINIYHWTASRAGELLGFATWDPGRFRAENLWLATNPACEDEALVVLLTQARQAATPTRPLTVNYPAGHGEAAFIQAGFKEINTLIWMETHF